jgi:hypothetical protein
MSTKKTRLLDWNDIPQFPRASYEIDVGWGYLESQIATAIKDGLDLDPAFQRAHVWTRKQQTQYVEYIARGGEVGKNLTFNHTMWDRCVGTPPPGCYTIVDGKQRLEAVRVFMRGELPIFAELDPSGIGYVSSDLTGHMRMHRLTFKWRVCTLASKKELLELYLNINAGGTPHTKAELDKVRMMLATAIDAGD